MKDNPRHWIAEKVSRKQPSLGTHEPNKPELCFQGEVGGHFQDIARSDAILDKREALHEPVARYFTLFHGEHQLYSAMKPCKPAIDALIADGTLLGQLTLDGEVEIYKADTKIKEPIDMSN